MAQLKNTNKDDISIVLSVIGYAGETTAYNKDSYGINSKSNVYNYTTSGSNYST